MHDLSSIEQFLQFTADELLVSPAELMAETEFRNIRTWSSLNALIFVSRISEETNVLISAGDLASCKTLGEIHSLVISRSNGAD